MVTKLTEKEETLLALYHCDHMNYLVSIESDAEADRIAFLNNILSDAEITNAIKNYNVRKFGLTFEQCKKEMCLRCSDYGICEKRKGNDSESSAEPQKNEIKNSCEISLENESTLLSMGFKKQVGGIRFKKRFEDNSAICVECGGSITLIAGVNPDCPAAFLFSSQNSDFFNALSFFC